MSRKQEVEKPHATCEPQFGHRWATESDLTECIAF